LRVPLGLFFGRVIAVDHVLPRFCLIVHDCISIADQRAKCRGIERLASVDAGQCGIDQDDGVANLLRLDRQPLALRAQQGGKVDRFAIEQPLDVAKAQPGFLERDDAMHPLQLGRPEPATARLGAQRRHQPARLIKAQRPCGQAGAADHFINGKRLIHAALMPVDLGSTSRGVLESRRILW